MVQTHKIRSLVQAIVNKAIAKDVTIACAESCTGGMIAAAITDVPGSSAAFDRGFITYSNEAKHELLGVPEELVRRHGAVSAAVARAMAQGALQSSAVDIAVSVTGVAGPGGGTNDKPVGLVWFGTAVRGGPIRVERRIFEAGARHFVRLRAVETALQLLLTDLSGLNRKQ